MRDEAFFVHYEKSVINPNAIIARGILVRRDYAKNFHNVKTYYNCSYMYLFEMGNTEMYQLTFGGYWTKKKAVLSKFYTDMKYKDCSVSHENIQKAVSNTPFRYSTWESYFGDASPDMLKFFELYANYPSVEYLTKLGMQAVVTTKLVGGQTLGVINWRGKTIDKVLRLSKAKAKEWVKQPFRGGVRSLYSYHFYKKRGINLDFIQAHLVNDFSESYRLSDINKLTSYAPFETIIRYFLKQLVREGKKKWYGNANNVMYDWRDYIKDCHELGLDLKQEHILFPNDLHAAHQKTMAKIKIKKDEKLTF
ncbi:PcfJ domain-containing protein [Candidatus Pristimantibacillus sp. PTI5]|uniref:PcfJ domain-containing protein n=1 Tax=Candidatus Pristimantibacillus sp. PTI5 TaxID=3400422 RepID=UPI003B02BA52